MSYFVRPTPPPSPVQTLCVCQPQAHDCCLTTRCPSLLPWFWSGSDPPPTPWALLGRALRPVFVPPPTSRSVAIGAPSPPTVFSAGGRSTSRPTEHSRSCARGIQWCGGRAGSVATEAGGRAFPWQRSSQHGRPRRLPQVSPSVLAVSLSPNDFLGCNKHTAKGRNDWDERGKPIREPRQVFQTALIAAACMERSDGW
ncbi:hypothetical protein E2C01_050000 [Portunus trituberculatus]|uniref:Uncharacterized protein n=1 Tax=Portunus trituberculatus TaxID=210409 RepID=A0A5B7G7U3_PORTR|nr:hypothetical protein [Portunus trituberculatus]